MKSHLRQVSEDVGVGDAEVSKDATIALGGAQVGGPPQQLKHIFKFYRSPFTIMEFIIPKSYTITYKKHIFYFSESISSHQISPSKSIYHLRFYQIHKLFHQRHKFFLDSCRTSKLSEEPERWHYSQNGGPDVLLHWHSNRQRRKIMIFNQQILLKGRIVLRTNYLATNSFSGCAVNRIIFSTASRLLDGKISHRKICQKFINILYQKGLRWRRREKGTDRKGLE